MSNSKLTPSKARARRKLWHRGNLDYFLWSDAQRKIEAKYKEVKARGGSFLFVNCSRRIGKTTWGVKKSIETLIKCDNEKPRIKFGAAYREDLEEFAIPAADMILEQKPPEIPVVWKPSKNKFFNPKLKGETKLVGLDLKPNGLRGTYADLIILEECGYMKRLDYQYGVVCHPMTMYRNGAMIVMVGTPPETPDHPFTFFAAKAKLEDAYIELTIDDNDRLTSEEKQKYLDECLTESDMMREYYCKIIVDRKRAIIPEWKDDFEMVWPRNEFFQYYHTYDAMDLGVVDQTACLFGFYDFHNATLAVEDELIMQGYEMTTDKLAAGIRAKEGELWGTKPVYYRASDNDNLLLIQDLGSLHGLTFSCTTKEKLEAMVNEVRLWVKAGRIRVNPRCKMLLGCLRSGIWDKTRKKFETSAIFGHFDALAALVYMVRNIRTDLNPVPAMYKLSTKTHHIPRDIQRPNTPNVQAVKKMLTGRRRGKPFSRR